MLPRRTLSGLGFRVFFRLGHTTISLSISGPKEGDVETKHPEGTPIFGTANHFSR